MQLFLIFLGGGLGASSRWLLSSGITTLTERTVLHRFPLGILTCNLLGCLLIGCLFGIAAEKSPAWIFPFLATGFLGGFTTFSTFSRDTFEAFHDHFHFLAFANILLSVLLGLTAVWAGIKLGQSLAP